MSSRKALLLAQAVSQSPTFEEALEQLGRAISDSLDPKPLRVSAVERAQDTVRRAALVALSDRRPFRTLSSASLGGQQRGHSNTRLIQIPIGSTRGAAGQGLSPHTTESLAQRGTRWVLVHGLVGTDSGDTTGFFAWEFAEKPRGFEDAASLATLISPWMCRSATPLPVHHQIDTDLPVVGVRMGRTLELLKRFLDLDEPILLFGETGVGKSRLARWAHRNSRRRTGPFERVNLAAAPSNLQAAELFGVSKGAYTSAVPRKGAVERAQGGTLFIDEVDKLPHETQVLLLDLLDNRQIRPVGANHSARTVDVRIIAGASGRLLERVQEGSFLPDLYHRLEVFPIRVPTLAERHEDIPGWASYFANECEKQRGGALCRVTDDAVRILQGQTWPGNLRELGSVIKRAHALTSPTAPVIEAQHIEAAARFGLGARASQGKTTSSQLVAAARSIAALVESRPGEPWLKSLQGFSGLVLRHLIESTDRRRAYELLGEPERLKGDNHHKHARRTLSAGAELLALVEV